MYKYMYTYIFFVKYILYILNKYIYIWDVPRQPGHRCEQNLKSLNSTLNSLKCSYQCTLSKNTWPLEKFQNGGYEMASFSSKFIGKVLELLNIFSETPNLQNLNCIFMVIFPALSNGLLRFWVRVSKEAQIRSNIEIF